MGYPGGHAGLLAVAIATHALVGYALGRLLIGRPWLGLVGGVAPDLDLLVDSWTVVAHRGFTHAPVAATFVVLGAAVATRRGATAGGLGLGYASHLFVDATTNRGIPLWLPISHEHVSIPGSAHSPEVTLFLWVACLALLWQASRRRRPSADRRDGATGNESDGATPQMTRSGRISRTIRSVSTGFW